MSKNSSATQPPATTNRIERAMAYAIAAIVVLSIVCFIAVVVGTSAGVGANDGFSHGIWPTVFLVPYIGLPIAFLLILAVLISNAVRRSRAAKRASDDAAQ